MSLFCELGIFLLDQFCLTLQAGVSPGRTLRYEGREAAASIRRLL